MVDLLVHLGAKIIKGGVLVEEGGLGGVFGGAFDLGGGGFLIGDFDRALAFKRGALDLNGNLIAC